MVKVKGFVGKNIILLALFVLCIVIAILNPVFISGSNIMNVLLQTSIKGIMAVGMTFVILTGGIDLSVGSTVALAGCASALIFQNAFGGNSSTGATVVFILVTLGIGALVGLINALLITKGRMAEFIATLGTQSIARGMALFISNARSVTGMPKAVQFLGAGKIGQIYVPIYLLFIVYILAFLFLRYRKSGRDIYAIGGNMEAARLSGINVHKTLFLVYILNGICAGVATILLTGRLNSAISTAGQNYELDAIAASVIGGTSLSGGKGNVIGTLIGALMITIMQNGLNLLNVSSYLQQIAVGSIIILSVLAQSIKKK